jgi:hypothetical protein
LALSSSSDKASAPSVLAPHKEGDKNVAERVRALNVELVEALNAVLDAWWAEVSDFFGGEPIADARNAKDFEAKLAVIAARAVIARANIQSANGESSTSEHSPEEYETQNSPDMGTLKDGPDGLTTE